MSSGYVSLGDVAYPANGVTDPIELYDAFSCVRRDLVDFCQLGDKIFDDTGSGWFFTLIINFGTDIFILISHDMYMYITASMTPFY